MQLTAPSIGVGSKASYPVKRVRGRQESTSGRMTVHSLVASIQLERRVAPPLIFLSRRTITANYLTRE